MERHLSGTNAATTTTKRYSVPDMTPAEAAGWVERELCKFEPDDAHAIAERIRIEGETLLDDEAAARWPVSAEAHRELIFQLTAMLSQSPRTLH